MLTEALLNNSFVLLGASIAPFLPLIISAIVLAVLAVTLATMARLQK